MIDIARAGVERAVEIVNSGQEFFFDTRRDIVVARAPGRLDLMGGIADYSGSLVLQWPIAEATVALAQVDDGGRITIVSGDRRFSMPLSDLAPGGEPIDYAGAAAYFEREPRDRWAAYASGCLLALMREGIVPQNAATGLRLLIASDVPEGKGVSSSAAIEVASMLATAAALGVNVDPRRLALLCQTVENKIAGAPCGVMDQMTSAMASAGKLFALLCQPAEVQEPVDLPEGLEVWGIDSGIRHAVSGSDYGTVRTAAAMGQWIIRSIFGSDAVPDGYLANVDASVFEGCHASSLPETMRGSEFADAYGDVFDPPAVVIPDLPYPVRAATAHPIHEHFRVRLFRQLLTATVDDTSAALLGDLMYQSHASYSRCGLGSTGTDRLVEIALTEGTAQGIFGAKITGGGSGGTVALLTRRGSEGVVREIARTYAGESGLTPYIFAGTSTGACELGPIRLRHVDGSWALD